MIGTLARKRTQLRLPLALAAALIVALAGAMFAGSAPVRAAEGDVTANRGFCVQSAANADGVVRVTTETDGDAVQVRNADNSLVDLTCEAALAGRLLRIVPNGTDQPDVTRIEPKVTFSVDGYPDLMIPAGTAGLTARVTFTDFVVFDHTDSAGAKSSMLVPPDYGATWNVDSTTNAGVDGNQEFLVTVEFLSSGVELPDFETVLRSDKSVRGGQGNELVNHQVVASWFVAPGLRGEFQYTITVNWDELTGLSGGVQTKTFTQTITFIDPASLPNNLTSASLSVFGTADNPLTSDDETAPGSDTAPAADGSIMLKLDVLNADGGPSSSSRLSTITVLGQGARLTIHSAVGGAPGTAGAPTLNSVSVSGAAAASTLFVEVDRQPGGQAGTVSVNALIIGDDGALETAPITLTFTGPAATVSLAGDASIGRAPAGSQVKTEIALSTADAAGNNVALNPDSVRYRITDADGDMVPASMIKAETSTVGSSTATARDNTNAPAALLTVDDSAAPGVYTITASLAGVTNSAGTAMLTVTGPAASLELSADRTTASMIGDEINLTAVVSDSDGNPVAEGSEVTFTSASSAVVVVGADANPGATGHQARTSGGEATATFAVVGGGSAVITAAIGNQTAVVIVISTAGQAPVVEEEEEPAEEPGAECLNRRISFATWTCTDGAYASTVFAELAGRGATALHLYNGMSWVRYSVVNGRMVPGSSDYRIQENDILYISN